MGRRPAVKQGETLRDIRSAAFRLFGRYGYDGVSMYAVAEAAGITKAALYWHYDSKEALFTDCLRELQSLFERHVFNRVISEQEPGQKLMAIFHGMVSLLKDPRIQEGVAGYWLDAATAELSEATQMQRRFEENAARLIAAAIEQGIEQGELEFEIPVEDMAQAIISTMEAIILPLRRMRSNESMRLIGSLAHTFFRAHATSDALAHEAMELAGKALKSSR
mgnify:CR=1 FL=1